MYDPIVKPASRKKVYFVSENLMPEQSEDNNHTIKINVFLVWHKNFFLLEGQ